MRRGLAALTLGVATLAGCASGGASSGAPGEPARTSRRGPSLRREDRVLLTEVDVIQRVAVSKRMVFAATQDALVIFDSQFNSWLPPLTAADGYEGGVVTALAADPVEDAVWAAANGAIHYYRPQLDFHTTAVVGGIPDAILFDRRDLLAGAYVHARNGWSLVSRTGFVRQVAPTDIPPASERVVTPTLADIYRQYPQLQSFQNLLLRDEQMQSYPVTAGSKDPDKSEVWLGTQGGGLYKIDPVFNQAEHYPFGLIQRGAGAIAPAADGVWIAGLGTDVGPRSGLTFASEDLQRWRWVQGPISRPLLGTRAYALSVRGRSAWVATDRGAMRLDTQNQNDIKTWSLGNGLPADQALSVAPTPGGAWVGTTRGLVFVADTLGRRGRTGVSGAMALGTAIRALRLTGDTLWIGSDAGLLLLATGDSAPRRPTAAETEPLLRRPIHAIVRSDSEVVVATATDLVRLRYPDGRVLPRYEALDFSALRGITAMDMDDRSIWVAGYAGVYVIERRGGSARLLVAPGDIPGQAYDVRLDPDYAWVATQNGVLRLRRLSSGGPP